MDIIRKINLSCIVINLCIFCFTFLMPYCSEFHALYLVYKLFAILFISSLLFLFGGKKSMLILISICSTCIWNVIDFIHYLRVSSDCW